jgi:hypothetical protein
MIHENKDEFIKSLERASRKKGFLLSLIERDYRPPSKKAPEFIRGMNCSFNFSAFFA